MPIPCIAAGACITATMAALGDCSAQPEPFEMEEGRIKAESGTPTADASDKYDSERSQWRTSVVQFQDDLPLATKNSQLATNTNAVASVRSILSKIKATKGGDRKTLIRKSVMMQSLMDEESVAGFIQGDFHSAKVLDIATSAWTMAYHPVDAAVLAVGLLDGKGVALYETLTFSEIYNLERDDTVSALAWLPIQPKGGHSMTLLAVGSLDGSVAIYKMQIDLIELQGIDLLYEYQCNSQVRCISFAKYDDSILLAVGEKVGIVTFISLSENGTHKETLNVDQHDSGILGLRICHTGSLLAACTKEGGVSVRRIHRVKGSFQLGVDLWHTKRNGPLRSIMFSQDDSQLVFGGYEKRVVIVDTKLWDVVRELQLEGTINTIAYDSKERYLLVGCRDNSFTLFDTSTFFPIKSIHTPGWVTCVSWGNAGESGDFVAIRAEETCISILDLTPIHKVDVRLTSQRENIASLSWSIDGRYLARTIGRQVLISDSLNQFKEVANVELKGTVKDVKFCPAKDSENLLACACLDGHLILLQLVGQASSFRLKTIKSIYLEENLFVLAWMPDASLIATGGRGKKLFIVSSSTMMLEGKPLEVEGQIHSIDFMPHAASIQAGARANSYSMAVGSSDCVATMYDVGNLQPTLRVVRPRPVRCLTYHPLLPILAIGDGGNIVSIVDILGEETSNEVRVKGRVNALAFSPAADFLVIGTDDCTFTLHETITFRIVQEIKVLGFALSAAFSGSSGQYLALGSANDDYAMIRLGPFLGTDLIPLGSAGGIDHLPTWACNEALYRSGYGPSLLQRNMIEGSQASLARAASILQDHPDTIYAFDRSTGDGCFQTALHLKKPNLLKLVMTTLVDGTLETDGNGRRTILTSGMPELGLSTLRHIIANFPSQNIVEILAEVTYIKVPFTEPREVSTTQAMECGSSSYGDPWVASAPRRGIKRSDREWTIQDGDESRDFVYRTPAVLPLPGLGSSKFLSSLLNGAPPTVFDNAAMGLVLHVMWEHFIRPYFLFDLVVFLIYYLLWTVLADWTSATTSATCDSWTSQEGALPTTLIGFNTVFAVKEIIQSNFGRRKGYYLSVWNAVDVLSIAFVYVYVILTFFPGGICTGNVPLAVFTTLLLTVKLLSYLRGFDSTGWLISVLLQNFRDVRGFLLVLVVMLVGFTTSFHLLFGDVKGQCIVQVDENGDIKQECSANPFSSIGRAFLSTFVLTVLGTYSDGILDASKYTRLAILILMLAVISVLVVALNALIAVLSDSYARVQEKAVANRRKERAELIVEYLSILPPPKRREIENNTRYFHALLEADEDGDLLIHKDDWQGGLNALRRDLEEMNAHSAELNHRAMDEWKASIDNDIAALRRDVVLMLEDASRDLKEIRRVQREGGVTFNSSNVAKAVRAVKSIGNRGLFGGGDNI